jgi:hypothetical protein
MDATKVLATHPSRRARAHTSSDERNCAHAGMKAVVVVGSGRQLMQRFAHGMSQPFDLVLDHQFSALQFDNLQIVCGKMHEGIV